MRFTKTWLVAILAAAGMTAGCSGGGANGSIVPATAPAPIQNNTFGQTAPAGPAKSNQTMHSNVTASTSIYVTGTVASYSGNVYTIHATGGACTSGGLLNIYASSTTKFSPGRPPVGASIAASGTGACTSAGVTANAIKVTSLGSSGGGTTGSGMPHVLTMDYLGTPWGSTSVAPSTAAKYLTWAETGPPNGNAMHLAGIKTIAYVDPNRTRSGVGDALYTGDESTFAHNCTNTRVYANYKGMAMYVMQPSASSMRNVFANYIRGIMAQGHIDAVFEDNAGDLSAFAPYEPFNTMPCSYSASAWLSAEQGLEAASPVPVVFNGLSGLNGHNVSLSVGLLANANTAGGTYEECYGTTSTPEMTGWVWAAMENSELAVGARNKIFQCWAQDSATASTATQARLFEYASFLLTYNPNTSIYRSAFGTPSGLHVMPETQLVPTSPLVATPSSVSSLQFSGGAYGRAYSTCYLKGVNVGACAIAVNPDASASHAFPFSGYHHTLYLSGNGVLDGGSVSTAGGAPPASMAPKTAAIAFP